MLKRDITYEDFDGEKVTETFYFNLSKHELIELEVYKNEGMDAYIRRIIKTNDRKTLIEEFKKIILLAYGIRSEDGKRFIKNDEVREAFSQTAAFDELFMELATSDGAAAEFIKGVLPASLGTAVDEASTQIAAETTDTQLPPPAISTR